MSRGVGIHYCWICSIDDSLFLLGRVGGKTMVHYLGWYMMTPVLPIPLNSSVHEYHEFCRSLVQNYPSCFLGQRTE